MERHDVHDLVFSSSCTVYGDPDTVPITEDTPLGANSPYGRTKLHIEEMLRDVAAIGGWRIALLRYFNPVGAHPSGLIGEDPVGIPNNLMPYTMQVAVGRRDHLTVNGGDYPTPDGTCIRDYIHVSDLVAAHAAALAHLRSGGENETFNCGYGHGYSVLDVIAAVKRVSGRDFPVRKRGRRPGDPAAIVADAARIRAKLGWVPQYDDLEQAGRQRLRAVRPPVLARRAGRMGAAAGRAGWGCRRGLGHVQQQRPQHRRQR